MCRPNKRGHTLSWIFLLAAIAFCPKASAVGKGDVDPKTKMVFPARISAFVRNGGIEYDQIGYPTAKYFAGEMGFASVFYYKQNPFPVEYANARDAVKQVSVSAKLISDGPCNLHPSGRRSVFTLESEFLGRPKTKLKSELLMFPNRDLYLTFRITYLASHADRMHQEIDTFVRGFRMP